MATGAPNATVSTDTAAHWCGRCQDRDTRVEAICYCSTCQRAFCSSCKDLHEDFTANHDILHASRKHEWGTHTTAAPVPRACQDHPGEEITIFCGQHNNLCCPRCDVTQHINCQSKSYIPDIAKGISESKELEDTVVQLQNMLLELGNMKNNKCKQRISLSESRERFQTAGNDVQSMVNSKLESLIEKAEQNVDEVCLKRQALIKEKKEKCERFFNELCSVEDQIRACSDTSANDCRMFILLKRGQELVLDCREFFNSASQSINYDIVYTVDKTILTSVAKENTLIEIQMYPEAGVPIASIRKITEHKVKDDKDKGTCYIQGICQLLDGTVVLSDNTNRNLKRLDKSYAVTEVLPLNDSPKGLCSFGNHEIAVALGDLKKLQLVCVTDKLRFDKCLDFDHACYSLACDKDMLYVTGKNEHVYAYNIDRCNKCASGYTARFKIEHPGLTDIALSQKGDLLYMVDTSNSLTIYDTQDKQKSTVQHKNLTKKTEKGVCVDTRGNVLVCSQTTGANCIVQFSNLGREATPLSVETSKGVDYPGLIFVDASQPKVIVQRNNYFWGSDTVCIADLGYD